MKLKSIFALVIFSCFFQIAQAHPVNEVRGYWHTVQPIYSPGIQYYLDFSFFDNQVQLNVQCAFQDGAYLQIATTSFAHYNWNQISIHPGPRGVLNDGYHYCEAYLAPGTWIAQFDQFGHMYLTPPAPYANQFILERSY